MGTPVANVVASAEACPAVVLSVVIPAYNEAERLPPFLRTVRQYGQRELQDHFEVVVVDDGSSDRLDEAADMTADNVRLIRHAANQGKGAAVRSGVAVARGEYILFADADGSTPIEEEQRLRQALQAGADVAVGSRRLASDDVVRNRRPLREWAGSAFARLATSLLGLPVSDPQCGFKMFRRAAANRLFTELEETGYYFDLELLLRAETRGYRIEEIAIHWAEKPGSRLRFSRELVRMMGALARLRRLKTKLRGGADETT